MLNNEIWEKINNLPYEISLQGVVRRQLESKFCKKNKTHVKPYINNKGYSCINLYKEGKCYKYQIHRLLAISFIPNPDNLPVINHKDGNPLNNALDNLEWCTQSQNLKHAWATGLFKNRNPNASVKRKISTSKYKGVSWSKQRDRWCVYITINNKSIGIGRYKDEIEAAKAYDTYVISNNLLEKGYSTNFI